MEKITIQLVKSSAGEELVELLRAYNMCHAGLDCLILDLGTRAIVAFPAIHVVSSSHAMEAARKSRRAQSRGGIST